MFNIGIDQFSGDILGDFHGFRDCPSLSYKTGNVI